MSFEADYTAALVAFPALNALCGNRIGIRLDQESGWPAVRFQRISTKQLYSMEGRNRLCLARVQHDCWSPDNAEAVAVADAIVQALDTIHFGSGSGRGNIILNRWFDTEPESEPVLYRFIVDAQIYFIDAV